MATHKLNNLMRISDLEEVVKRMPQDADRADIQFLLDVIKEKERDLAYYKNIADRQLERLINLPPQQD